MSLSQFKERVILEGLEISKEEFPRILCFIDFGNVNYWFDEDVRDADNNILPEGKKLGIDLDKLKAFLSYFTDKQKFYYGFDPQNPLSISFIRAAQHVFGKQVFTKKIQKIKHYLNEEDQPGTRALHTDKNGAFVYIPKCNFDVEISVDAVRLLDTYDTFCLLSGDSDFISLIRFLRSHGKKTILIKSGYITKEMAKESDLTVNAQDIKKYITVIKDKKAKNLAQ